jgi:hypothetical protein
MRTRGCTAVVFVMLLLAPLAMAEELVTRVTLQDAGALAEVDLGITTGAVSPDGQDVLVAGQHGFARLLSAEEAENRELDVELVTGRNSTIQDISWHPRGNTALLVGDAGFAMRYDSDDHSITYVNGTFSVLGHDLTTVTWRSAGDFAYVGASDGSVWKFAEHTGFERLENLGNTPVVDITCHRNYNVCFIASKDEGIAVIDGDHTVSWMGQTSGQTWVSIDCSNPGLNECMGFASGLKVRVIQINTISPRQSTVGGLDGIPLPTGEQTDVSRGHDGTGLIHLAPLGLVRYDALAERVFTVLLPEDAAAWDATIAGRSLEVVWETGYHRGYFITGFGNVVSFSPATEDVEMGIMDVLVLGAVAVSVPGVILGLIYMNSPWLQRKYTELRFGKKKKQN